MMHCVWFSKGNALPDVDVGTPRSSFDRLSNQLVSHGDAVVSEPIGTMPIQPLLDAEGAAFDPDDIKAITAAYEIALKRLDVVDRCYGRPGRKSHNSNRQRRRARSEAPKRKSSTRSFRVSLN